MRKIYRQIRMCSILTILIIISFIIHSYFTVAVSSLGKRRYRNIGSHKYLWNRLLGHSAEYCLRQKRRFWNKVLNEHIDIQSLNCFRRDENKTGIFSYFVPENFEEVRCSNKTVQFSKTNMTQVALANYPGSGDTWYRHLIEAISGIATGSQYCSRRTRDTFIGQCEKDTSKTIAVNTHQFGESIKRKSRFDKVILILRNPYDVIIDEFGRRTVKTTATGEKTRFKTKEWSKFVMKTSTEWRDHTLSWLNAWEGPLYISYYEKMKFERYEELYRLTTFLGVNVTVRDLWCAVESREHLRENLDWLQHSVVYSVPLSKIVQKDLDKVQTRVIREQRIKWN